jgi:Cysteine-rich CPXCG
MKRPIPGKQLPKPDVKLSDAQSIDVKYGLEPVIDPSVSADDGGAPGGMQFHLVECPYCGESFETPVDTSSGSAAASCSNLVDRICSSGMLTLT